MSGDLNSPAFADLDGDGDLDAIIGESSGPLVYYENTGTGLAPTYTKRTGASNPLDNIDVGRRSTPSFADLDGDGDLDAVIGNVSGTLAYYENTGNKLEPVYTERTGAVNPLSEVQVLYGTNASLADLDGDGDVDVVIGKGRGNIHYYENIGSGFGFVLNTTQLPGPTRRCRCHDRHPGQRYDRCTGR